MRALTIVTGGLAAASLMLGLCGPMAVLAAGPDSVSLDSASHFAVLAKSGISTTGATAVTGDVGVSPADASSITGFSLVLPASSSFATSALVTGKVYAPSYAAPTPADITTAIHDMEAAYVDAAGRTNPTATELGAGNLGGLTLAPGLYKWGTGVTISSDLTLSGGAEDVWIFQIAQNLDVSSATKIVLAGGAKASHVFWAVGGQTTIGTTAVFKGTILDKTAIAMKTGATLEGRAFAQTAVTLEANAVALPTTLEQSDSGTSSGSSDQSSSGSGSSSSSDVSTTASVTSTATVTPSSEAAPVSEMIHDPSHVDALIANMGETRSTADEAKWQPLIHSDAIDFKVGLSATQLTTVTNFVTYGNTDATQNLGAGERRAVLRDYFETVGRPDVNFADLQRMTTGAKPVERNLTKERENVGDVLKAYVKIFGRAPNFGVPSEDLAWNTLMYRVRFDRDLTAEATGITKFRAAFHRNPSSPLDWSAVRVWGYVLK